MAKVYCMQVEILLTASDITYQAVKHRSVRAVWQKLSCFVPALFTNSHSGGVLMFSVFATRKRSFLFVYQKTK